MPGLLTISLNKIRFYGQHGLYAEERKVGNEFEIDLHVHYHTDESVIHTMSSTINYVSLYNLLKAQMQQPRELLETFLMETVEKIHTSFPLVEKVEISILKLQAPISGVQGAVGVQYSKNFLEDKS